ncbi:Putative Holin-X, holin superfamily III [Friedmanniella luteola]|uniref:Putative Holin-X, holin superfamily III n=1 Tax=Friedmanniella luteola TaxID=546871 RepID=A0A1H1PRB2_9ACTN|nr:phage holin family protein [Friedmanniella luteola]SDS13802.1 Putative Holin-X, holin superfamily III [Friedmanniella luteola]
MSTPSPDPTPTGAGATAVGGPPPGSAPDQQSVGELVSSLSADLSRLVRDEMRLAQAEVTTKAKKAGIGVGAFGAAGVLALYAVGVLLAAAVLGLATALPGWLAALVVGVVVLVVAAVAALVGKKKVQEAAPPVPTRAVESVKADVQEIKESVKR